MTLDEYTFTLTPLNPVASLAGKYYAWIRAFGAHFSHADYVNTLPTSLAKQYQDNVMIIGFDHASNGIFPIEKYARNSCFEIGFWARNDLPNNLEVTLRVVLRSRANLSTRPKVQTFTGYNPYKDFEWGDPLNTNVSEYDPEGSLFIKFEAPDYRDPPESVENGILILIRPVTKTGWIGFVKATATFAGFI